MSAPSGGSDTLARARAELAAHPGSRPWSRDALFLALASLGICLLMVAAKGHPHWIQNQSPTPVTVALALLLGVVTVGGAGVGLSPGRVARWPWALAALLSGFSVVGLASGVGAGPLLSGAARCAGMELAVAALPLVLALWALTRFSATPLQTVAASGCALGAGVLALHLHCPNGLPAHLFLGHVVPAVAILALVWPVRRMMRSWSYAP